MEGLSVFWVGAGIGLVVGAVMRVVRGDTRLGVTYGAVAAGVVLAWDKFVISQRAEGLTGMGEFAIGVAYLMCVVVPAAIFSVELERRRFRARAEERDADSH